VERLTHDNAKLSRAVVDWGAEIKRLKAVEAALTTQVAQVEHLSQPSPASSLDQPAPIPNSSTPLWELVIADMRERDAVGRQRYGTPLQAHNGRDALADAYAECLDQAVYLKQAIVEHAQPSPAGWQLVPIEPTDAMLELPQQFDDRTDASTGSP
jgi:hypothetical protein